MNVRLDKRLRAVVDEISCDCLADIGCDHGKVSVVSRIENKAQKVIACDISKDSLQKAVELGKLYKIENIQFRCGSGLDVLQDGEVDCAVIAGMGGLEIISILSGGTKGINKFILVAHRNTIELREFLSQNNLYIDKDYVVKENGKYYNIIVAVDDKSKDTGLSQKQLYLGKNSPMNSDYLEYIDSLRQKYNTLKEYSSKSPQIALLKKIMEFV